MSEPAYQYTNSDEWADWPDNWEVPILEFIPCLERNLVALARKLQSDAVEVLRKHRDADGDAEAVNLGIVVRVREDTLGPRVHWVRFRGKARYRLAGSKFVPTEVITMQGKFRYSSRIFAPFPNETKEQLIAIEKELSWVRYRTERLAALRDFCRKTQAGTY